MPTLRLLAMRGIKAWRVELRKYGICWEEIKRTGIPDTIGFQSVKTGSKPLPLASTDPYQDH